MWRHVLVPESWWKNECPEIRSIEADEELQLTPRGTRAERRIVVKLRPEWSDEEEGSEGEGEEAFAYAYYSFGEDGDAEAGRRRRNRQLQREKTCFTRLNDQARHRRLFGDDDDGGDEGDGAARYGVRVRLRLRLRLRVKG